LLDPQRRDADRLILLQIEMHPRTPAILNLK